MNFGGLFSDVYSFGISLAVHILQKDPYESFYLNTRDFLDLVNEPFINLRPSLPYLNKECPNSNIQDISIQLDNILKELSIKSSEVNTPNTNVSRL